MGRKGHPLLQIDAAAPGHKVEDATCHTFTCELNDEVTPIGEIKKIKKYVDLVMHSSIINHNVGGLGIKRVVYPITFFPVSCN